MNVGVVLPNWIGDVVMATPTLRNLKRHFGHDVRLIGVMRPYVRDVLAGSNLLEQEVLFDPRSSDRSHHTWSVGRQLRRMNVEVMVLLTNSVRSAALAWLSGAQQRIGYARGGRRWLLTQALTAPRVAGGWKPISAVDYYLQLSYALGAGQDSGIPVLNTLPADDDAARHVWKSFGIPAGASVVVLNTGGAYGQAKHWPSSYFSHLASRIAVEREEWVIILCGPAERQQATLIEQQAAHPRVRSLAAFPSSIGLTKAVVRRAQRMITTDSGPRHFSHPFQVPVLTIFGPTDPQWSETRHPQSIHVQEAMDCSPCGKRVCPLGHHRCMVDLTPERVYRYYERFCELLNPVRRAA
ncbi:MAG: lipopolysaccharide heptosyltransferase II [Planctomycetota bacterium]|nr:lipopolysaccharide heptosyltransferase II [Planctomycetota bacterium]MDA1177245.1 lipopolysaccharide heptosyltransferase II [Planctomycetota bacterium]